MTKIKIKPSREEFSKSRVRDTLKKLGYIQKLILGNIKKISPDYILIYNNFINSFFISNNNKSLNNYNF